MLAVVLAETRGRYDDSLQCAKKSLPPPPPATRTSCSGARRGSTRHRRRGLPQLRRRNAEGFGRTGWAVREFTWDNKYVGVQVLLSKVLLAGGGDGDYADTLKQFRAKAGFFMCACIQKNGGNNTSQMDYVLDKNPLSMRTPELDGVARPELNELNGVARSRTAWRS
ncbi:Endoglucanase 13 [Hordeum vulgare]|nr:Endoglucanase 13 [Hordeum vulgare]